MVLGSEMLGCMTFTETYSSFQCLHVFRNKVSHDPVKRIPLPSWMYHGCIWSWESVSSSVKNSSRSCKRCKLRNRAILLFWCFLYIFSVMLVTPSDIAIWTLHIYISLSQYYTILDCLQSSISRLSRSSTQVSVATATFLTKRGFRRNAASVQQLQCAGLEVKASQTPKNDCHGFGSCGVSTCRSHTKPALPWPWEVSCRPKHIRYIIYIYTHMCVCGVYIYTYIHAINIRIHVYIYTVWIYIYIYIHINIYM